MIPEQACTYCMASLGTTRDHVVPRLFFPEPKPSDLATVPSCLKCNNDASGHEEYFRNVIVGLLCHSDSGDAIWDSAMHRSFIRSPRVEDRFWSSLKAEEDLVWLDIDFDRIFLVAAKISLALLRHSNPLTWSLGFRVRVDPFSEIESPKESCRDWEPAFVYSIDTESGSWSFVLHECVRFSGTYILRSP